MDRSRRTTHRRRPLGESASPRSASEASFDLNLSTSPVAAHINTTPQSAHSGGVRRSSKPIQRAFTFSPPGPNRGLNLRKRSAIMDNFSMADDDEDGPKKGGHSLRKRARVDYTFEHIEDDVVVPNSSSSARGRKRRTETNFDTEELYSTDPKRRGASMGADTPSARRRNPSRKSSEMKAYREALEDDDNDVQDTIEVGISYSDVDGSETHEPSWSNPSSPHSTKTPPKPDPAVPPSDSKHQNRPSIEDATETPRPTPRTGPQTTLDAFFSKSRPEKAASQPAERLQSESTKVEPRAEASPLPRTPLPATDAITAAPSTTSTELPATEPKPIAAEPAANSTAAEPATIQPVVEPIIVQHPATESRVTEPPTAESPVVDAPFAESTAVEPSAPEPAAVEITTLEIAAAEPTTAEPAAIDTAAIDAAAVDAVAVDAAAVDAAAVDTAPVDTAAVDTAPIDTAPVDTALVDLAAVGTAPVGIAVVGIAAGETAGEAVVAKSAAPETAIAPPLVTVDEVTESAALEPAALEPPTIEPPTLQPVTTVEAVVIQPPISESIQLPSQIQVNGESNARPKDVVEESSEAPNHIKREADEEVTNATCVTPPRDKEAQNNEDQDNKDLNNENLEIENLDNENKMDIDPVVDLAQDTEMAESEHEEPAHISTPQTAQETPASPNLNNETPRPNTADEKVDQIDPEPSNPVLEFPNTIRSSNSPQPLPILKDPTPSSRFEELKAPTPSPTIETSDSLPSTQSEPKSSPKKIAPLRPTMAKPQPAPTGRWSHLTPYMDGEFVLYPEKKGRFEEDNTADESTPDGKDTDREGIDMEPMVEDNDDNADTAVLEAPTPALNTPTRGSPVPESTDPTAFNSPAPAGEDPDDADVSESQEPPDRRRYFKYRKLRDPEEYISAIENFEDMPTADLFEILESINVSLVEWQHEWTGLGRVVDDYENALRRRAADTKYESRTRNLHQHGVNYEEPDFGVKGYKAREKEGMTETRYLQGQDRIMAANYGFEYDPHPSKIGRQNPETQQVGIMTRGRSLRNQPRQTAKATETDEVTGKRQRKPVLLFDPAPAQDVSRSSTPVPTRGSRWRRGANGEGEETQSNPNTSFNTDVVSDGESTLAKTRRRRGPRGKGAVPSIVEELVPEQDGDESAANEEFAKPIRRGRGRPAIRYEEADPNDFVDEEPQPEVKQPRRHLLTLKIPRGKHFSEPTSAITDNGDSRPSTASSEESSQTAESSYSFRPKRQKRFRDDPEGSEEAAQAPPKKRGKRANASLGASDGIPAPSGPTSEPSQTPNNRKVHKIKVVRSGTDGRNGAAPPTPIAPIEDSEEPQKDYKSMTKSEKMSASMKNRWANGNMAGAVEKRKATLAAKKAAQAAADQKLGVIAPKPKGKAAAKKEAAMQLQQQQQQQHQQHHQHQQQQHQQQQHQQQQLHMQQQQQLHQQQQQQQQQQHPQQHPAHQGGNPNFVHSMPGMGGYSYQQM